jgi:hypothetical protein
MSGIFHYQGEPRGEKGQLPIGLPKTAAGRQRNTEENITQASGKRKKEKPSGTIF